MSSSAHGSRHRDRSKPQLPAGETSVGPRTWLGEEGVRRNGAVYTPRVIADYVAEVAVTLLASEAGRESSRELVVLDPACGDGELLAAVQSRLVLQSGSPGMLQLVGSDIDPRAIHAARQRLGAGAFLLNVDAICPTNESQPEVAWRTLLEEGGASLPDLVIANPPWGATPTIARQALGEAGYSLANGQFDTSDLFVELAVRLVRPSGVLALILPDSLFAVDREALRRVLLRELDLHLIARLGEGLFDSVFRGAAVIVGRKRSSRPRAITRCFRLTPTWRRRIQAGESDLQSADAALAHLVPTERFRSNARKAFDIDVTISDESLMQKMAASGSRIAAFLSGTRGIELSKTGAVVQCVACGLWSPRPRAIMKCRHCGTEEAPGRTEAIIFDREQDGYRQLIVGEDVARHIASPSRWIDTGRPGISFKDPAIYRGPKLLVRKTGVGISAAMDYSDSLTNQVVYIFRCLTGRTSWIPLDFWAAYLASRPMFYFLAKSHGEIEWRSHPYVTQRHILELPAPSEAALASAREDVLMVGQLVRDRAARLEPISDAEDTMIERVVCSVLGISLEDYSRIFAFLDSAPSLAPIRALRSITPRDVFMESRGP